MSWLTDAFSEIEIGDLYKNARTTVVGKRIVAITTRHSIVVSLFIGLTSPSEAVFSGSSRAA